MNSQLRRYRFKPVSERERTDTAGLPRGFTPIGKSHAWPPGATVCYAFHNPSMPVIFAHARTIDGLHVTFPMYNGDVPGDVCERYDVAMFNATVHLARHGHIEFRNLARDTTLPDSPCPDDDRNVALDMAMGFARAGAIITINGAVATPNDLMA